MTTRRELIAGAALLAPLALAMRGARATGESEKAGHEGHKMADFLFVQNAREVSFGEDRLTLRGVNPVTVMFSDRPERIAGHMTTAHFVPFWGEGRTASSRTLPMRLCPSWRTGSLPTRLSSCATRFWKGTA